MARKSKAPYEWGPATKPGRVPWCAFVGYQIRHDGALRLRPSSLKKEVEKHNHILGRVGRFLRRDVNPEARDRFCIVYGSVFAASLLEEALLVTVFSLHHSLGRKVFGY